MSTKYKKAQDVPTEQIVKRLEQLSDAVTKGRDAVDKEFTMRVPPENDRDADIVLSEAARRLGGTVYVVRNEPDFSQIGGIFRDEKAANEEAKRRSMLGIKWRVEPFIVQ